MKVQQGAEGADNDDQAIPQTGEIYGIDSGSYLRQDGAEQSSTDSQGRSHTEEKSHAKVAQPGPGGLELGPQEEA